MIIPPRKSSQSVKNQISNIWTAAPSIRAGASYTPKSALKAAFVLRKFHTRVLDVLEFFLQPPTRLATISLDRISDEKGSLTQDAWGFGIFWSQIQEEYKTTETLYAQIGRRREEITALREAMRSKIHEIEGLTEALEEGQMSLIPYGISGSYVLVDAVGEPKFVIKPIDEDIGAIHNPKGWASPFEMSPIRKGIPLYLSSYREVAAYEIAKQLGIGSVVPKTAFYLVESKQFHDLSESVRPKELQKYLEQLGPADKEKLCSVQEFVPESKTLFEAFQELQSAGLLDEEIEHLLDQTDFEEANILLWVTGDTDGHAGNFLVTPKRTDEIGNQIFGLRKIDNGLAFPEVHGQAVNALSHLPNAHHPLSKEGLAKVQQIDPIQVANRLKELGLEGASKATSERIAYLQKITREDPPLSIRTIHKRLKAYEKS